MQSARTTRSVKMSEPLRRIVGGTSEGPSSNKKAALDAAHFFRDARKICNESRLPAARRVIERQRRFNLALFIFPSRGERVSRMRRAAVRAPLRRFGEEKFQSGHTTQPLWRSPCFGSFRTSASEHEPLPVQWPQQARQKKAVCLKGHVQGNIPRRASIRRRP